MTKPKPKELHLPPGRPKRTEAEVQELCDKLLNWANNHDAYSFDEFASIVMNVTRSTLNFWCEAYPSFSEAFNKAKGILRNRWLKGALIGKLNPYVLNNFYYQLSDEHKDWIREMKAKEKSDPIINVTVPQFDKSK